MKTKDDVEKKNPPSRQREPVLRFPEFREAGDWENKRVSDFFDQSEKAKKADCFEKEKLITVKLHALGVVRNENNATLSGGANYFKRRAGQFIFSKIDLLNGAFGIIPAELDGFYSSSDVPAFTFKKREYSEYFDKWMIANYTKLNLQRSGTSNTLKRVSVSSILDLSILTPCVNEQQKIVECISTIDALIFFYSEKLKKIKAHKQGVVQRLFPQENETAPSLRFNEFTNDRPWSAHKISYLLQKVANPVEVKSGDLYKQIGIRSHGRGIFYKEPISGEALGNKRVFWVSEEVFIVNIVFAWEQAVATTSIKEKGMIASHRFPMYKAKENRCDIGYIKHYFLTKKGKMLLSIASPGGAGRNKTLGQKEFDNIEIMIPRDIKEQQKIASCISCLDELIDTETRAIEALKRHKQGLMQGLFPQPEEIT